jgi:predicted nucleic acid-binding protein
MPAVFSDTSGLHYLSVTSQFDCLPKIFGDVLIPPAVWKEASHRQELSVHSNVVKAMASGWLKVESPHDRRTVESLQAFLGTGESEAITLAKEHPPSLLLMDDLDGRSAAQKMKLAVMGTVGVLVQARKAGHLPQLKPVLDALMATHRFRLSEAQYAEALREAGEAN